MHRACPISGAQQVERLRDRLASTGELAEAVALYSSLMPRAIETAEILAPALGGLEVRSECDFCEGHPGEADGLTWAELDERYPVESGWDGNTKRAPGWETWVEMGDRIAGPSSRSWTGTRVRRWWSPATGAWWCTRCCTTSGSTSPAAAPAAWFAADNTSLTECRFAPNPYEKSTLPVQLVRYNDHAPPRRRRSTRQTPHSDLSRHGRAVTSGACTGGGIQRGSTSSLGSRGRIARSMALQRVCELPKNRTA